MKQAYQNLDYANAGEIEQTYLEIDPEWQLDSSVSVAKRSYDNGATGTSCGTPGVTTDGIYQIQKGASNAVATCQKMSFNFDLSTIPSDGIITSTSFTYDISSIINGANLALYPMTVDLSSATADEIYTDATDGTAIITGMDGSTTGLKTVSLPSNTFSGSSATVGLFYDDLVRDGTSREMQFNGANTKLTVGYTIPPPYLPPPPSNLQTGTVQSNQVNL